MLIGFGSRLEDFMNVAADGSLWLTYRPSSQPLGFKTSTIHFIFCDLFIFKTIGACCRSTAGGCARMLWSRQEGDVL
ncbi:MAG: hypothetical protein EB015_08095 [Methylocystaceae bacterium]|nr:hypothetical protein [Methylocystaceae bacterium]